MVMKYSISNLGSTAPKRKPLSTTSQQLAQQVAGQQITTGQQGVGIQQPAGGQPQLTSPLDTQTGRQAIKTPPQGPLGQGGQGGTQGPGAGAIGTTLTATEFAGERRKPSENGMTETYKETGGQAGVLKAEKEKEKNLQEANERARKLAEQKALANKAAGVGPMGGEPTLTDEEAINKAISDLLHEQTDVAAEREAMLGEMRAQEARGIQGLRARAGLGGMGLTGATAGLEAQARTEAGRAQALTTAQFDRAAREEALNRLIQGIQLKRGEEVYGAGMDLYEAAADRDFDGDGLIQGQKVGENNVGDGNPSNNTGAAAADGAGGEGGVGGIPAGIPSTQQQINEAQKQGSVTKNNNPELYNYYKNLPWSAQPFPTDQRIDSFVDGNMAFGVYKNANGELYISSMGFGNIVGIDLTGGSRSKR